METKLPKEANIVVCGSRTWTDEDLIFKALDLVTSVFANPRIWHGGCRGADLIAGKWAQGSGVKETIVQPAWDTYGKAAGPMRNQKMLETAQPEMLVAFLDHSESRGTQGMIQLALSMDVPWIQIFRDIPVDGM